MNPFRVLSTFLVASTVFLALGAVILRVENLVPLPLTYTTSVVIVAILTVAFYTWKENFIAVTLGVILAIISIVFNTLQPAHISAILHPFGSITLTTLVITDVAGFYLFPALYVIVYLAAYRKLRTFSVLTQLQSTG